MPIRLSLAAVLLLALSGVAFWPAYLSKVQQADGYTHAHAALGTTWLLLLVVQPLLVAAAMRPQHRWLGRVGVLVGAAFFISGVLIAHRSLVRMGAEQFAREGRFVYLPLAMAGIFAAALVMAVLWRSTPALHARFMAATALPLLDPLLARILFFYFPPLPAQYLYQVPAFLLVALALAGLCVSLRGPAHACLPLRRFAWGVAAVLLGFFAVPHSEAWLSFVGWFRALPLT
jgi:hypothetical protein